MWDELTRRPCPADTPVAVGGELSSATLVGAYRAGIFPWPAGDAAVPWWCPDPRAVIPVGRVRVARSLRSRLRSCGWTTTVDRCFGDVVRRCRRGGPDAWMTPELIAGYLELHALGWAHSVEVWDGAELVGGHFGVLLGGVYTGESMFHVATDASKVALVDFEARFAAGGGVLIDVQLATAHLRTLGAVAVPRADFLAILRAVRDTDVRLTTDRLPVARLAPPRPPAPRTEPTPHPQPASGPS
jgi:leucyl/phenylalanyl-tRNA--protein transferase